MQTVGHTTNNIFNTRKRKQYVWDVNDRLKQVKDEKGTTKFEHDGWSNLAKTIYPDGEEQLRNPDAVGNLFKTIDRKDRVYGKGGQLKKANGWSYEYDEEGNLIKKEHIGGDVWKYEWNDAGMLMKVIRPDYEEVSFSYDALGRRLSKQFKNTITKFVWDDNVPLHEWKENATTGKILGTLEVDEDGDIRRGNAAITWLFDTDSFAPAAKIKNGKTYSIVADHLGTPSQMYKEDGELFWEAELDSYGKVHVEKGEPGSCPFKYKGQYEDGEIGLYYNRYRYYSSLEGIYISQDPIGLKGGKNFYSYVKDTNLWVDAFGLVGSYSGNLRMNASDMTIVKKGSKEWHDAVKAAKQAHANGQKFNIRVATKDDAHAFLKEVNNGKGMDRRKAHTQNKASGDEKYQKGYEVHQQPESGYTDKQHLKYYTNGPGTGSHIFYD
jgi:RHS repeat-associated protein